MINEILQKEFNERINKEFFSEYLYLAMKTHFMKLNLKGFAKFCDTQAAEEHKHATEMINYLIDRGGSVELLAVNKPVIAGRTPAEIFEQALQHEESVTSAINGFAKIAEETHDRAALLFINDFIKEQVEEEALFGNIVSALKFIGDDKTALLILDKDFAKQAFKSEV